LASSRLSFARCYLSASVSRRTPMGKPFPLTPTSPPSPPRPLPLLLLLRQQRRQRWCRPISWDCRAMAARLDMPRTMGATRRTRILIPRCAANVPFHPSCITITRTRTHTRRAPRQPCRFPHPRRHLQRRALPWRRRLRRPAATPPLAFRDPGKVPSRGESRRRRLIRMRKNRLFRSMLRRLNLPLSRPR